MFYKLKARIISNATSLALSVALLLLPASQVSATQDLHSKMPNDSNQSKSLAEFDPLDLAERISAGLVSEKQFIDLDLSEDQILEVFKNLADKRGWKVDNNLLAEVARDIKQNPVITERATASLTASSGRCDENIEIQEGWSNLVYPFRYTKPTSGESCGSGKWDKFAPDRVLEYRLPNRPGNPQTVRWWSNRWFVRRVLQTVFGGVLGSNGFCGNTVRVCIGSKAFPFLGPSDFMTVYLWWPR